jgi:hypothetical protein
MKNLGAGVASIEIEAVRRIQPRCWFLSERNLGRLLRVLRDTKTLANRVAVDADRATSRGNRRRSLVRDTFRQEPDFVPARSHQKWTLARRSRSDRVRAIIGRGLVYGTGKGGSPVVEIKGTARPPRHASAQEDIRQEGATNAGLTVTQYPAFCRYSHE